MLNRKIYFTLTLMGLSGLAQVAAEVPDWVARSDSYTELLLAVGMRHHPERGSWQGLSEYDTKVSQPTLADEDAERRETEAVVAKLKEALSQPQPTQVKQDLQILISRVALTFREQDFQRAHEVPFLNASASVFRGVQFLLDEQTPAERRPAAVVRLRKYAGLEPGCQPLVEILRQRVKEQMAKPGVLYPARTELETELGRNPQYLEGIKALLDKYQLPDGQEAYGKLKSQLAEYDEWTRTNVLPKARTDFRLPAEEYSLALEDYGIQMPAEQLAAEAHKAFGDIQAQMQPIAAQVARDKQMPSNDYRAVIRELKKQQIEGDAILALYRGRLKEIEKIILEHAIVSLPERPARIRLATVAETAQQPAPHMVAPPFLHNTGQKGEFVLPLNIPASGGKPAEKYDDFTFDAAAWTLTAHEARPGHELRFDSMLEHGMSRARVLYAFNSANAEGWGLYSEYLILPFMPPEGQLVSLDERLLRAARAFLDPELQAGKIQPAEAYRVLEQEVVLSHAAAQQEVERYTYRAPGRPAAIFMATPSCSRCEKRRKPSWARSSTRSSSTISFSLRACSRPTCCVKQ